MKKLLPILLIAFLGFSCKKDRHEKSYATNSASERYLFTSIRDISPIRVFTYSDEIHDLNCRSASDIRIASINSFQDFTNSRFTGTFITFLGENKLAIGDATDFDTIPITQSGDKIMYMGFPILTRSENSLIMSQYFALTKTPNGEKLDWGIIGNEDYKNTIHNGLSYGDTAAARSYKLVFQK